MPGGSVGFPVGDGGRSPPITGPLVRIVGVVVLGAALLLSPPPLQAQQRATEIGDFRYFRQVTPTADRSFIQTIARGEGLGLLWQCDDRALRIEMISRDRFRGRPALVTYRLQGDTTSRTGTWSPGPSSGPPRAPAETVTRLTEAGRGSDSVFVRVRSESDTAAARLGLDGFEAALSRLPCGR